MATVILACKTLEQELNERMARLGCGYPVVWLEAGDHNVPRRRRDAIQDALDSIPPGSTVLMAMTFCGNALAGVRSGSHRLVLPRWDDCIGMLLPSPRHQDTYYLTDGWILGCQSIAQEYRRAVNRYGTEKAKQIFAAMLRNYRYLCYVRTCGSRFDSYVKDLADKLGLAYTEIEAYLSPLDRLLLGEWDKNFLQVEPESTITLLMREGKEHG